jgi:osmotically-inducible protein OsmY
MNGRELRVAVEEELDWEPSIDAKGIGVAVNDGIVTLSGHVGTYPEKTHAEHVAARVKGVRGVVAELEVRLHKTHQHTDEEIARAASNALSWNTVLPKEKIKVWVENGRVTLEGTVHWQYQRIAADHAVRYLSGVRDVNNHIAVRPVADRDTVKSEIDAALRRSAEIDARSILVKARGNKVVLWGSVRTWEEREEAERAAWACPGVVAVDNNITVNTPIAVMSGT